MCFWFIKKNHSYSHSFKIQTALDVLCFSTWIEGSSISILVWFSARINGRKHINGTERYSVLVFCCCFLMEMVLNKNPSLCHGLSTANHYGVDTGFHSVKSIDRGQPSGTTGVRYDMGLASDFKQGSRANGPYFCCFWGAIFHLTHIRKQFVPMLSNVHSMLLMVYIK